MFRYVNMTYNRKNMNYMYNQQMQELPLAQAFVIYQPYVGIVTPEEGLKRGSMFPNLYDPYKKKY